VKPKRRGGPATSFGKNQLTIDQPGFWPSLTDEEVELMAGKLRPRLTAKQAKRADKELEVRAERKKRAKQPKPKKRRRKSPTRFVGEGEYSRYGRRVDDLRGEFTVGAGKGQGWHKPKQIGSSGHSHSYRVTVTRGGPDDEREIVRKCRCGRTEQWFGGEWQLLDEGRK